MGIAAAVAVSVAAGAHLGLPGRLGLAIAAVGGGLMSLAAVGRRGAALVAAVGIVAVGLGVARGAAGARPAAEAARPSAVVVEGTVVDAPTPRGHESLVVVAPERSSAGELAGNVLVATVGPMTLLPGDRVRVEASGLRPPGNRPGALSATALGREGVELVAVAPRLTRIALGTRSLPRLVASARHSLAAAVDAHLEEPTATLVDGLALGIRRRLPLDLTTSFQDSGLIHLLATSGLKVAVVLTLVARLLDRLALPPRPRTASLVAAAAAYVTLTGASPAATRAALMASAALLARGTTRRLDPLPLLAVVATAMLLVDPGLAGDVGYQLSVVGTLGIVLLADPIGTRLPLPHVLAEPVAVTVAAQALTFPITATTFGSVSLIAPLTNAVALPLLPPLLVTAWTGAVLGAVSSTLGWLPLVLAGLCTRGIEAVARWGAAVPLAAAHPGRWDVSWTGASLAAVLAVLSAIGARWAWTARLRRPAPSPRSWSWPALSPPGALGPSLAAAGGAALAAVLAVDLLALGTRPDGRLHVSVLDVGAAPAVLVRTAVGGVALIDGGSEPSRLLRALGDTLPATTRTLDLLVVTGGERAASEGLEGLVGRYAVRRIVLPRAGLSAAALATVEALRRRGAEVLVDSGRPWRWDGATWWCLPLSGVDLDSPAQPACVLRVADASGSALLLGDAPAAAQEELTGISPLPPTDLVVTPPGGAVAAALVDTVRPSFIAVPSSRAPTLRLGSPGVAVSTTAGDGTLTYVGGSHGLRPP